MQWKGYIKGFLFAMSLIYVKGIQAQPSHTEMTSISCDSAKYARNILMAMDSTKGRGLIIVCGRADSNIYISPGWLIHPKAGDSIRLLQNIFEKIKRVFSRIPGL